MSTRTTLILIVLLSLALALAGMLLFPRMTSGLAVHWNIQGEADRYGTPFEALYLFPLAILFTSVLILVIPVIDPLRKNVERFRPVLNTFVFAFAIYFAYLDILSILWNLGFHFNMNQLLAPGMGLFIFFAGVLLANARPNWFIGIRTPWTLSSTTVWDKTHQLGGWLFKLAGIIAVLGIFFPGAAFWLLIIPLLGISLFLVIYSYVIFRKEQIERSGGPV